MEGRNGRKERGRGIGEGGKERQGGRNGEREAGWEARRVFMKVTRWETDDEPTEQEKCLFNKALLDQINVKNVAAHKNSFDGFFCLMTLRTH